MLSVKRHAHPAQCKNCYVKPYTGWNITSFAWNDKASPSVTIAHNPTGSRMWHHKNTIYNTIFNMIFIFFCHGSTALGGLGLLHQVHRSHTDTPQSVGLLWTGDRPVAETSTWRNTTLTTDRDSHAHGGTRTRNPSKRTAVDPRLRPRGQWDRRNFDYWGINFTRRKWRQ